LHVPGFLTTAQRTNRRKGLNGVGWPSVGAQTEQAKKLAEKSEGTEMNARLHVLIEPLKS
jgi:hypothetical protein